MRFNLSALNMFKHIIPSSSLQLHSITLDLIAHIFNTMRFFYIVIKSIKGFSVNNVAKSMKFGKPRLLGSLTIKVKNVPERNKTLAAITDNEK